MATKTQEPLYNVNTIPYVKKGGYGGWRRRVALERRGRGETAYVINQFVIMFVAPPKLHPQTAHFHMLPKPESGRHGILS